MKYFKTTDYLNIREKPNGQWLGTMKPNTIVYNIGEPKWEKNILWANVLSYVTTGEWVQGYSAVGQDDEIYLQNWEPHVKLGNPYKERVYLTQMFGENPADYKEFNLDGHNGVDLSVGKPVGIYSIAPGIVEKAEYDITGYGNFVMIAGATCRIVYAHLSSILVTPGFYHEAGTLIGQEGATGNVSGPHLHIDLRRKDEDNSNNGYGSRIDILPYLNWDNIVFPSYVNILNSLKGKEK